MKHKLFLPCLILSLASTAFAESLDQGTELTIAPPWKQPIDLAPLPEGRYRLEATNLANDPVEVVVDRKDLGGSWVATGTNRTLRGSLDGYVDLAVGPEEAWQVRPVQTERGTVILRLRKAMFAELKETLKQNLTPGTAVPLPLKKRLDLAAAGGPGLAAAVGSSGTLWIGWLTDGGWGAEVWDAVRGQRLGPVLQADSSPWTSLTLGGQDGPVATLTSAKGSTARVWTGRDWSVEAAETVALLTTRWGTFRTETNPVRVLQEKNTGWLDLALPRDDQADLVLLGSTDDGLAAFLASSKSAHRAFYSWRPEQGWLALPPPPAEGFPWTALWAVTAGAGSLFHLEGRDNELILRQFDGTEWRAGLDLGVLAPGGARAAMLLPPSTWSKSGTLVLVTDHVAVYDLP